MHCLACKSKLEVIEYQARSADEPPRRIEKCPLCPLDIDKFGGTRRAPHAHLHRSDRMKSSIQHIDASGARPMFELHTHILSTASMPDIEMEPVICCNLLQDRTKLFRYYSSGPHKDMAVYSGAEEQVGPRSTVKMLEVLEHDYIEGQYYEHARYGLLEHGYILSGPGWRTIVVPMSNSSPRTITESMHLSYYMGGCPSSLSACFSQITLGAMSNLSARAYDAYSADERYYDFSTKPDGERMWLTRVGYVWLLSRRLMKHVIVGWLCSSPSDHLRQTLYGPVIDVEFMASSSPILIDILMNESGSISQHSRNVHWIMHEFSRMRDILPILSKIYVRPFYRTLQEAREYQNGVQYPTDGIVAVSRMNTDMLKLKAVKSMELQLGPDSILYTSDHKALLRMHDRGSYPDGAILEVRFSVASGIFSLLGIMERPDKTTANDSSAVESIVLSTFRKTSKQAVRTSIWRWSNKIRVYMYNRARVVCGDKRVILDIGTGDGQSVDAFQADSTYSYILVEPDRDKCNRLSQRLRIGEIHTEARSLIPAIPQLKKGTRRYHILNMTLQDMLSDDAVSNNMKGTVGCCVSCFSAQYIVDCILSLKHLSIGFIGSCYMYDDIKPGMSIIDSAGITMKRISPTSATVKWGTDDEYIEPALETHDLPDIITVVPSRDVVAISSQDTTEAALNACSHMKILISL